MLAVAVAVLPVCAGLRSLTMANALSPRVGVDAVPLYLTARAVTEGLDPTEQATLEAILEREGGEISPSVVATLYPASAAVLLQGFTRPGWPWFLQAWRIIALVVLALGCAAAGWGSARGRWAPLGAAVGAGIALVGHPLTHHALVLGQSSLLIAGLLGLVLWALARDQPGVAGAFAMVGAAIKIVPAMVVWPLLMARRWRGLAIIAAVGLVLLLVTMWFVPLDRILADIERTARYQHGVVPAWVGPDQNLWSPFLGLFRHAPLGIITLAITGVCAWAAWDAGPRRAAVLAECLALSTAWLGADGAAVGVFFGLLLLPALISLATWPLSAGAPRWTWLLVPVVACPWLMVTAYHGSVQAALQMLLAGLVIWVATTVKLVHTSWDLVSRRGLAVVLVVVLAALGWTANKSLRTHSPEDGPLQRPIGPHVGPHVPHGGHVPRQPPPN